MIKKFNEMYSNDDVLGTIRDILDSQILDEFDVELGKFGWSVETKFVYDPPYGQHRRYMHPSKMYQYELSDGEEVLVDSNGEEFDGLDISLYEVEDQSEFFHIELTCTDKYLKENFNIINSIKSSVLLIESMTDLTLTNDLSSGYFQNSIFTGEWRSVIHIDWKNIKEEEVKRFLSSKSPNRDLIIQIFLK